MQTLERITAPHDVAAMRHAGRLVALAHRAVREAIGPGVNTRTLDAIAERVIREGGGRPAFKGHHGFPATICASPNEVVVHGFPNGRKLRAGDILTVDIGAEYGGFFADSAWTHPVGEVAPEVGRLLAVTEAALYAGLAVARAGRTIEEVAGAIQDVAEDAGFSLLTDYGGHGIGRVLHAPPHVPNVRTGARGPRLVVGQGLAIEPMVVIGSPRVVTKRDGWTVVTRDGSWAAHFEHTILVREGAPEILTALPAD